MQVKYAVFGKCFPIQYGVVARNFCETVVEMALTGVGLQVHHGMAAAYFAYLTTVAASACVSIDWVRHEKRECRG